MPSGLPPAARTQEVIPESLHRIAHQYAKKAAGNPAAFRFLSEPLRGHKSRASFPTVRAELRPDSAWALRAAIPWHPWRGAVLWRSSGLSGYAIVFIPYYGFWSVLIRVMPQNTQKSGGIKPPLFAFYQNHSAGTGLRHFHNPCARTASGLSPVSLVRPCRLRRPS